jgi:hypothetical protein
MLLRCSCCCSSHCVLLLQVLVVALQAGWCAAARQIIRQVI